MSFPWAHRPEYVRTQALSAQAVQAQRRGVEVAQAAFCGGTPAWAKAELPLAEGMPLALCAEDDIWYKPYTDVNAKPEAMMGYFDWEFGLVENIMKDGDAHFALIDPHNG